MWSGVSGKGSLRRSPRGGCLNEVRQGKSISDTGKHIPYAEAPGGSPVSITWGQPETELTAGTEWLVSHTTIAWGQNIYTGFAVVPTGDHIDLAWHQS